MAQYTKEELREIFRAPFNRESWKAILHNLFRADNIRLEAEQFTDPDEPEQGYFMGVHETSDSYRIGLFYYKIDNGSVAHKKVGLRSLVKRFINPTWGNFDAAIVVFNDGKEWRLSFVCDIKDVATTPKRFTFVFGEHDNFYNTASQRFYDLQQEEATFKNIREAFSVDALSDDFFDDYRELYADFVQYITGKRYVPDGSKWVERELSRPNYQFETSFNCDEKEVRDYIKKMFGRITFLYFLQRKGWLNGDKQYMHNLFYNSDKKDNFLDGVLETLFFNVLNENKQYRDNSVDELPGGRDIPYLNGGLFAKDDDDEKTCVFPENYFKRLFDFLDSYNFTIDENDAEDAEIGIDPEMLGRIFESLLEDNKDKGAYYTPKEIVSYMCRESIINFLIADMPDNLHEGIRHLVETFDASKLDDNAKLTIRRKLQGLKICDPAIGSGAFPMGLVNLLSHLYIAMKADTDTTKMKRHIMENNIYGVDIEKGAVDIARLRFWLAMIVEEKDPMPLPNLHFKIMRGNSLLETYRGLDLSDLTRVNAQKSFWDSTNADRESLVSDLKRYYGESDHTDRQRIFDSIIKNVRRQIHAKDENLSQKGLDPSDNSQFFLWHTWFADVFDNGGFDIVIANPPYIDSETMTNLGLDEEREYISSKYKYISGNWDMYMAFLERGLSMCKGCMCFITPDKWLSKPFGKKFRKECMVKKLRSIVHAGSDVFENATVDAIITLFCQSSKKIEASVFNRDKTIEKRGSINSDEIPNPYLIDSLFSPFASLISKIESNSVSKIVSLAKCEGACSTGDAYKLVPLITEKCDSQSYKLVNTGTLDKFVSRWGNKPIVYLTKELGSRPLTPYVSIEKFERTFGKAYITKARGPKIILKGLNLLDAFVDVEGCYLPGKTTLVVNSDDTDLLHYITAILNSAFSIFYLKTKYSSSSYCGGITFTKEMIDELPIPSLSENMKTRLICLAKQAANIRENNPSADITEFISEIDIIIIRSFNLVYSEFKLICPDAAITELDYINYKLD